MRRAPFVLPLVLLVSSCEYGFDFWTSDHLGVHQCDIYWHSPLSAVAWMQFDFFLWHHHPVVCPITVSFPGQHHFVAGTIEDRGDPVGDYVRAFVENYDGQWVGGSQADFLYDPAMIRVAQIGFAYYAATSISNPSSDYGTYEVRYWSAFFAGAQIHIRNNAMS